MSADASEPPPPLATSPLRQRKRPVRTYSRRSAPVRDHEPILPAAAQDKSQRHLDSSSECTKSTPPPTALPKHNPGDEPPKCGSILAYFKPIHPGSDSAASDLLFSSDPAEPASTPPSSPPPLLVAKPRKRRRLTTRPQYNDSDGGSRDLGDVDGDGDTTEDVRNAPPLDSRIRNNTMPDVKNTTQDSAASSSGSLGEIPVNVLRHGTGTPSASSTTAAEDCLLQDKKRPGKRPARDLTQTTLSLSLQKDPGFTICAVCDLLYNPLNEKDRREHKRRHAAYSRAKEKEKEPKRGNFEGGLKRSRSG